MSEKVLLDLQMDLVARAQADAVLGCVPVLDQRKGDIGKDVAQALGLLTEAQGKLGACIVLLAPIGDVEYSDAPGGPLLMEVTFRILEDPVLNMSEAGGTLKSAEELAVRLVRVFQHFSPSGIASTLVAKKPTIVPVADPMAPVAYEVRLECVENQAQGFQKVMTPQLSVDEGTAPQTVTITCGTAGAKIYYTLDGKYPSAANGTLYAGALTIDAAATLRAAAVAIDHVDSDVAVGVYT